jgi:hypothetical protein
MTAAFSDFNFGTAVEFTNNDITAGTMNCNHNHDSMTTIPPSTPTTTKHTRRTTSDDDDDVDDDDDNNSNDDSQQFDQVERQYAAASKPRSIEIRRSHVVCCGLQSGVPSVWFEFRCMSVILHLVFNLANSTSSSVLFETTA